jgi:hypothetical protein
MKEFENKIENTINSFDGIQKAEAAPFFNTRVQARLDKTLEQNKVWLPVRKPVLVFATLCCLLVLNIMLLKETPAQQQDKQGNATAQPATIQGFASDYNLNTTTTY